MAYQIKKDSGFSIVHLTGDIDLSCSPEARKSILDSLASAQPTLVDMSAVTYIDSSGVASLVEGYQTAKKKSLEFGLLGVSEAALSVLELARLDRVFPIYATLKDRLAKNA
jgi:anti-sigma B factor antagonist